MENQKDTWNQAYSEDPSFFGQGSSWPAKKLSGLLENQPGLKILELGGGQGRDTLFLASKGFDVTMIECSEIGLVQTESSARKRGLSALVHLVHDDLKERIPFSSEHFDACYSHMFLCMPLSLDRLRSLFTEISRVLKPEGVHVFSVRNNHDAHYGQGKHSEDQVFEMDGFAVRFFDEDMIRKFSTNLHIEEISEFQEGELPRTLSLVVARKT
jgi:ubiquinone/menaquinone biosynthesis C-methylase UbiE